LISGAGTAAGTQQDSTPAADDTQQRYNGSDVTLTSQNEPGE